MSALIGMYPVISKPVSDMMPLTGILGSCWKRSKSIARWVLFPSPVCVHVSVFLLTLQWFLGYWDEGVTIPASGPPLVTSFVQNPCICFRLHFSTLPIKYRIKWAYAFLRLEGVRRKRQKQRGVRSNTILKDAGPIWGWCTWKNSGRGGVCEGR